MCLGMNPDILAAGRALRLDLEPQLRGPPGRRRPHAPRSARRWPPPPRSPATSPTCGTLGVKAAPPGDGRAAVLDRARRRHRPDHPEAVPEADRALGLRRVPLLRLDEGSRLRAAPARSTRARRSSSPDATSAAARRASTRPGRSRTPASASCSRRASATSSAPNAIKTGLAPIELGRGRAGAAQGGARAAATS